jgi:hypothetical protein
MHDLRKALGAFAGDVFKMRRRAANHRAERDQCIVLPAGRHGFQGQRHFESARYANDFYVNSFGTVAHQRVDRALQQALADKAVETSESNSKARAARDQIAINAFYVIHPDTFFSLLCRR